MQPTLSRKGREDKGRLIPQKYYNKEYQNEFLDNIPKKNHMSHWKHKIEPEEECDQEVHAGVCSQQEDAQMEVHIQFDLKPDIFVLLDLSKLYYINLISVRM